MLPIMTWLLVNWVQPFIVDGFYFWNVANAEKFVLVASLFYFMRKQEYVLAKSLITAACLYYGYIMVTDPFIENISLLHHTIEMLIVSVAILFQVAKKKNTVSDMYQRGYVYLIFYKPKTFREWVVSLFGAPYASMGSIIDNEVFRPRRKTSKMCCHNIKLLKQEDYLLINTGVLASKLAKNTKEQLLKQPIRSKKRLWTRTNCVEAQKILLEQLPKKCHYTNRWYFIPSIYLLNLLRKLKR